MLKLLLAQAMYSGSYTVPMLLIVAGRRLAEHREDFPGHRGQGSLDGACQL
jgi:hypothetical protein